MTPDGRRPLVIGHRGAKGVMPENTLPAVAHALEIGCDLVEIDVHLTRDGVPVVIHDARLNPEIARSSDGAWIEPPGPEIFALTLDDLRRYEVGALRPSSDLAGRFPDQARLEGIVIPTLAEVLELAAPHDARLLVEVKSDAKGPEPAILTSVVLDAVAGFGLADRIILQSFDWQVLGEVAQRAPGIPRSYLSNSSHPGAPRNVASPVHGDGSALPEAVWRAGGAVWAPYHGDLTRAGLRSAHALGLSVFAWTANEVADIDRLLELDVDGIITDYPSRVQQRAKPPTAPAPD